MRKLFIKLLAIFFFILPISAQDITPLILTVKSYPLTNEESEYIKKVNPYGFVFVEKDFKKKIDLNSLKSDLNQLLGHKVYFFVDQEGGQVNRLKYLFPAKKFYSARHYGNIAEEHGLEMASEAVFKNAKEMAQLLSMISVDVNLAPNAELRPPDYNGFFKTRLYSEDPQTVAKLSEAFAQGTRAGGLEPCFKHFPGTALSELDPHKGIPVIEEVNIKKLTGREFIPFAPVKEYKYVMMGHALYPQIDAKNISTFSPKIYKLLRNKLGFNGLIITDALNMQATGDIPIGEKMALALSAGADLAMPFFSDDMPFSKRLEEIKKIPSEIIVKFNKKLDSLE